MRWRLGLLLILGITLLSSINAEEENDGVVQEEVDDDDTQQSPRLSASDDEEISSYESPVPQAGKFFFVDHFDNKDEFAKKWIKSEAKKDDTAEEIAKYDGEWSIESPKKLIWRNDFGLVLKSKAKHSAISAKLDKPFVFNDKPLIVQYEITMQEVQECGGSYLKLLSKGKDTDNLKKFNDKTPYTIMFGPDKCGSDPKVHFIFRHVNPINGSINEKHCKKPKERLENPFKDKIPHLYRLIVNPDNTFQIHVDHALFQEGSLLTDFNPPVNPPKEIDDPSDIKPDNWDEREKIPDPDAQKPNDWDDTAPAEIPDPNAVKPDGWVDEPEYIPDPNAQKPDDWNTEIDDEWEPPLIENPACENAVGCGTWTPPNIPNPGYKGVWRAPFIDNPNYQGKWAPRRIKNPDYFEDLTPYKMTPISAVGFELWSMSSDILFDNLLITDNLASAEEWATKTFDLKRRHIDKASKTLWERAMRYMGYKPGWWALYFLYCAIPFGFYIRYLLKRAKEESFFGKLVSLTNENPWLWGVYIVVIGTPLTFAIYMLCCANKDKDTAGKAKKTDEPSPDDVPDDDQEGNEKETETTDKPADEIKVESGQKSKKSDLEIGNSIDEIKESKENEQVDDQEGVTTEETGDAVETEGTIPNADGTRKRKARKE